MKKIFSVFAVAAIAGATLFGTIGPANAIPVTENFGPFSSVDTNPASTFNFTSTQSGIINDLDVSLTFDSIFGFVFADDMEITLSHLGTTVLISDNSLGFGFTPITFVLDDDGGVGTLLPSNPLSAFDGLQFAGLWTISFLDTVLPGELVDVNGFLSADVTQSVPEPGAIALIGFGLMSLGVARRRRKTA